ncbi:MAG TPA: contact-dependent growth inhibition system immunity protein [Terriglobales bacterium]|nr:contact-dependent growth inhibition system immunity protein [Terriglobales bacterium]
MTKENNPWRTRYPLLHQFFRGYLHQDFPEAYGSVAGALRQYRDDAGAEEFANFAAEWRRFLDEARDLAASDVDAILSADLQGSWHIASQREIARFTEAVERSGSSRVS